jgi:hypothetical protein
MEAVGGQKHPWEAENGMKELIYWNKYLIKVSQQPQNPLADLSYDLRQKSYDFWGHRGYSCCAKRAERAQSA